MQIKKELTCRECAFFGDKDCPCNSAIWQTAQRFVCKKFKGVLPQHKQINTPQWVAQTIKQSGVKEFPFISYTKRGDNEKDPFFCKQTEYMVKTKDYINGTVFDNSGNLKYFAKAYYVKDKQVNVDIPLAKWHVDIYIDCKEAQTLHAHDHTIYQDGQILYERNEYDWPIGWHTKHFSDLSPRQRTQYMKALIFALDEYHKDFSDGCVDKNDNKKVKLYINGDGTLNCEWKRINREVAIRLFATLKKLLMAKGDELNALGKERWPLYFVVKQKSIPVSFTKGVKRGSNQIE